MNDAIQRFDSYRQLAKLATRLQSDPDYMAWVLLTYRRIEGLSETNLIERLATNADMFTRLAICKRPIPTAPPFSEQVRQVADYTLIDVGILANLIRQVDAVTHHAHVLSGQSTAESHPATSPIPSGILAAARDRVDAEPEDDEESSGPAESVDGETDL